jgi:enoyl-CoA hydratase
MSDESAVLYHTENAVAIITLNRPDSLNAINQAMRDGLVAAIRQAEHDPAIRVVMVRGAGPRAFCAGADITEFEMPSSVVDARQAKQSPQWIDALADTIKPTIAAIHGFCLGGGLEIALACDIRIAALDAAFALPETTLAIIPGAGGTQRLSRAIGLASALRLTLTGERITADEAWRIGLVSELVPSDNLAERALALASMIAAQAPQAIAYAKEAVRHGFDLPLPAGLRLERSLSSILAATSDRLEAAQAFRGRRKPKFRGM